MKSKIELSLSLLLAAIASSCFTIQAEAQETINSLGAACQSGLSPEACEAVRAHDRMNVQSYDQYGRPIPSVYELCREGQMSGGPVTEACEVNDLRFNREGERLVRYDFAKWGYNALDMGVTEKESAKLDSNSAFRAAYIKAHGYVRMSEAERSAQGAASADPFGEVVMVRDGIKIHRNDLAGYCSGHPYDAACIDVVAASKQKETQDEEARFTVGAQAIRAKYADQIGRSGFFGSLVSKNAKKNMDAELSTYAQRNYRTFDPVTETFQKNHWTIPSERSVLPAATTN